MARFLSMEVRQGSILKDLATLLTFNRLDPPYQLLPAQR